MIINFSHSGHAGIIDVQCETNDDPAAKGCGQDALGLPYCKATVSSTAQGYLGMLGWVQLVRSGDNISDGDSFEMDPFYLFQNVDSPYAFFGYLPTLFDGPARSHRTDMDWLAHSFLAVTPLNGDGREVVFLAGFSWGFSFHDGDVALRPAKALLPKKWDRHIPFLSNTYPNWSFVKASSLTA